MPKKYSKSERTKIAEAINNIDIYNAYMEIAKIIKEDSSIKNDKNYTINQNGIIFITNDLSDGTIEKLDKFLKNKLPKMKTEKKAYGGSVFNNFTEDGETEVRISSKEKKFINRINTSKVIDEMLESEKAPKKKRAKTK